MIRTVNDKKLVFIMLFFSVGFANILFLNSCSDKKNIEKVEFLIDWQAGPEYAGYIVAKEKGFYSDEGLNVELIEGNGANEAAQLIGSGKYKIGVTSATAILLLNDKSQIIKSAAVIFSKSPVSIYSIKKKNITEPKDLIGKKLGVLYQSSAYHEYKALMNYNNLKTDKVNEVGISWGIEPILHNDVDAAMGYTQNQPNLLRLEKEDVNEILVSDWGLDIYSSVIAVNPEFFISNKENVRKIVKASLKGWKYAKDHPEDTVKIIISTYPALRNDFVHLSLKSTLKLVNFKTKPLGLQEEKKWQHTADMLFDLKLIKKKPDIQTIFTNDLFK